MNTIRQNLKKILGQAASYLFNWEWRTQKTYFIQRLITFLYLQNRARLPLTQIDRLSKEIPFRMFIIRTSEIHKSNEWYGVATILKQYAGIRNNVPIKACIEHGFYPSKDIFIQDRQSHLPLMITMSEARAIFLSKETKKKAVAVGPYIHYAKKHLDSDSFAKEKKRLGRNLLVFPLHSSGLKAHYDKKKLFEKIKSMKKNFDSVRICIYWKDAKHGDGEYFRKQGLECVTAGYMLDPMFLPRLRTIIELSDFTVSMDPGTHVGYCVVLKKPHYIIKGGFYYTGCKRSMAVRNRGEHASCYKRIMKAFSKFETHITENQYDIVNQFWGLDKIRSQKELRSILLEAEKLYDPNLPRGVGEM